MLAEVEKALRKLDAQVSEILARRACRHSRKRESHR